VSSIYSLEGKHYHWDDEGKYTDEYSSIDQVICGAETGPGARPMELDWARSVRDQCQAAEVPFFFKRDSDGNRELDGRRWEEMPRCDEENNKAGNPPPESE
jgi:hypothetical protein